MANERTLSIIKPDAVAGNHIGAIYDRFEKAGLKIVAAKIGKVYYKHDYRSTEGIEYLRKSGVIVFKVEEE